MTAGGLTSCATTVSATVARVASTRRWAAVDALLDEGDRGLRGLAVRDEGLGDPADLVDAHEDHERAGESGEGRPVDQGALVVGGDVPADHGELVGDAPVGDRDTGRAGDRDGAGDAGDDGARDARLGQRLRLLHAPAEDERVAAPSRRPPCPAWRAR